MNIPKYDFVDFADRVLIALAEENSAEPSTATDLGELCDRKSIPYHKAWLAELPKYFEELGYGTAESTLKSWRFRLRGKGFAFAADLRRQRDANVLGDSPSKTEILPLKLPFETSSVSRERKPLEKRFDFLIESASKEIPDALKGLYARAAAKGTLQSGATIKQAVRETEDILEKCIDECLRSVTIAANKQPLSRVLFINQLVNQVMPLLNLTAYHVGFDLSKHGLDRSLVMPMMEEVKKRRLAQIEQYRAGWTAPVGKPWKERHPMLHDIFVALIGALAGLVVARLMGG